MVPKQLTAQNFLSYREVVLNFDGLHVACVCGPNGAGKSSLLEAIAWCVWGQSRVSAEDDIIRQGALEAQVSFEFIHGGQHYRIIRTRRRNQLSALEFQILAESGFKSLTAKGVRATQSRIVQQLAIDYETFVNAAYLRQGRADEFMLKRPSERKQVLADLLKLNHYDRLAETAKEQARTYKAQLLPLENQLKRIGQQLENRACIQTSYDALVSALAQDDHRQKQLSDRQADLQRHAQQMAAISQKQQLLQAQHGHRLSALQMTQTALETAEKRLESAKEILSRADDISQQYQQLQVLQVAEQQQTETFVQYQQLQSAQLACQKRINQAQHQRQVRKAQIDAQLQELSVQEIDLLETLEKKSEIAQQIETLNVAKKKLHQLNKSEAASAPLRQRFYQVQGQLEQAQTRISTQIEAIDTRQAQLATQQRQQPQLERSAQEIAHRLSYLKQRQEYQEAVRQKGVERRTFMEGLRANQRNHEVELARYDRMLTLLSDPQAAHCPLCEQALEGESWQGLRDRTLEERDDIQNQIWAIREQLAVSEKEIQVLRQEYRELEEELAKYEPFLEERGEIKARLKTVQMLKVQLDAMGEERSQLERCLKENDYAADLQTELQSIEAQITAMGYDDRDHALVRSQVERLRWSEIKQADIKRAERRLAQLRQQRPLLEADLNQIQAELAADEEHPDAIALSDLTRQLTDLDYSLEAHQNIRTQIQQAQPVQRQYETLKAAQLQHAALLDNIAQLEETATGQQAALADTNTALSELTAQLEAIPAEVDSITHVDAQLLDLQTRRTEQLSRKGQLEQQLAEIETLSQQQQQQTQALRETRHKYQVYRALSEAFGRNGIQALMIENLLPQLESRTNQILSRLSDHQLQVQFVTQRKSQRKRAIDTLDILIADAHGTRPYETYSGGEAFRVNFSIRLAIAQLLTLQSGTALQMLIVDEGFGTQDKAGCERLIAAIEAIAPDFACILTITHMPHFREAFQTRIDVSKDELGSHITISG